MRVLHRINIHNDAPLSTLELLDGLNYGFKSENNGKKRVGVHPWLAGLWG
jgi:hypothetical protein